MNYTSNCVENIKIAYIGGGSRGWAWGLMSDLVSADDISGEVFLYDIDLEAAKKNEYIGNKFNHAQGAKSHWEYHAVAAIEEALTGADFVVISILPGTFDEMHSDVHTPEKYGICQSVGDSTGPGGLIRAMRTVPMYEFFAEKIRECCPDAWVINYTNPMTLCVRTLYRVFPQIRAFGCCHEVFGTQKLLAEMVMEHFGVTGVDRSEIRVNPVGVNHFTWLTKATWRNHDLFEIYPEFCRRRMEDRAEAPQADAGWLNKNFSTREWVKMDLFRRFGYIAAAGDRHLAEFCEGKWYLEDPARVEEMGFALTSVDWRKEKERKRLEESRRLFSGEKDVEIAPTGEEGVQQIRALLGLGVLVTNVNIPNVGQIPNLPMNAVVESNAVFSAGSLTPVFAGEIPHSILPLIGRICTEQEQISKGIERRDLDILFGAFLNDPLVTCSMKDAEKLFREMIGNTKEYLSMYPLDTL